MVIKGTKYFNNSCAHDSLAPGQINLWPKLLRLRRPPAAILSPTTRTQYNQTKKKEDVNRSQMPFPPRCRKRHVEPRLVAEPIKARTPAPAFLQVQSHGRGLQLRGRVQEP